MASDSERLIAAMARDQRVRGELDARGLLYRDGYNPEMQEVHEANADLLAGIVAKHGWPDAARFGAEAATAAWMIAQHAIARPDFMRACLAAMKAGGAAGWQIAMIEDRIAVFEGRPQTWGTQFDLDDAGELVAQPIADPDTLDARRAAIGLEPLDKA
ncbi:MAG: hypothetical protein H7X93_12855, partial [Sphingomonadaceae bacterium]|nr:hypothetical protein [Sphingomonadaceae bacterium]